jgi:signal peptidase I
MALFGKGNTKKKKTPITWGEKLWDFVQSLGVALILALMIKHSVVEAYKIPSGSMERTLLIGDFLLANKFVYGMRLPIPFTDIKLPALKEPRPGDIIIFKYPKDPRQNFIKRCIAVEGQKVKIINKQVYVDGIPIDLPARGQHVDQSIYPYGGGGFPDDRGGDRDNMPEIEVPKGYLFMMGDNRDNSSDSRFWGFLKRDLVLGQAMIIHWSWAQDPRAPRVSPSNPLSYPMNIAYNIYHLPERVRWERIGDIIR